MKLEFRRLLVLFFIFLGLVCLWGVGVLGKEVDYLQSKEFQLINADLEYLKDSPELIGSSKNNTQFFQNNETKLAIVQEDLIKREIIKRKYYVENINYSNLLTVGNENNTSDIESSEIINSSNKVYCYQGESYMFINNDTTFHYVSVEADNHGINAAVYNKDGSERYLGFLSNSYSLNIPSGGKVIISAEQNTTGKISFDDTYFTSTISEKPALMRASMKTGDSYVFTNNDTNRHYLETNCNLSSKLNVAVYNKDGTEYYFQLFNSGLNSSGTSIQVPAGGKAVLTVEKMDSSVSSIEVGSYYNYFTGAISEKPALMRVSMKTGDSYVFTNNDTNRHYLETNCNLSSKLNVAVYNKDGTEYLCYLFNSGLNSSGTSIQVPAGGKAVLTVEKMDSSVSSIEVGSYYNYFTGAISEKPALMRASMKTGDSYVFTNNDTNRHYLDTNCNLSSKLNVAVYNKDGTEYLCYLFNSGLNSSGTSIQVPAGGKAVLTVEKMDSSVSSIEVGSYYNYFTSAISEKPALMRASMKTGDNYVFTNTDSRDHYLLTNSYLRGTLNIRVYKKDGTQYSSYLSDHNVKSDILIPAGGTADIKIESIDDGVDSIEFGGYYNFFQIKQKEAVLMEITISSLANKLSYCINEIIDLAGLHVVGTYSDGTTKEETITLENITGFDSSKAAKDQVLTITVNGKTATFTVQIFDPNERTLGDVDGNGSVSAYDALMALQIATGKKIGTPAEITAADVDKSGSVSAYDALRILQYATGKISNF